MRVVRDKIEEEFLVVFRQAERIATSLDISPSVLRTVWRQTNQTNIPANTPEEYYRRVLAIPFLEFRFNELNQRASTLLTLIASLITKPDYHGENMADLIGIYRHDLPNADIVDQELLLWKNCRICKEVRWKEIPKCVCALEDRVHIANNTLRVRDKFFSNEGITKLAKKKYENRPINFSHTNEHSSWYSSRLRWSGKVVFSASPQENQSKKT